LIDPQEKRPVRIIAIVNQKGGCGKTTTAINLSAILARRGYRSLLVDMDPQSHCAVGLGIPENRIDLDIGDAMLTSHERQLDKARLIWRMGKNLDLLPSRMRLAGLESSRGGLVDKADKERRLWGVLSRFTSHYDVAVIDCSPAIGLLTFNALAAAQVVIVPVETGYFSLQGATRQVNTVRTVAKKLGSVLPVWVLPTIHDEHNAVACDLLAELRRRFAQRTIPVVIRRDDRLREAATFGKAIVDHAGDSRGAADYSALASWAILHGLVAGAAPTATEDDLPDAMDMPYEPDAAVMREGASAESVPGLTPSGIEAKPAMAPTARPAPALAAPVGANAEEQGDDASENEPAVAEARPQTRAEEMVRRAQEIVRRTLEARRAAGVTTPAPTDLPQNRGGETAAGEPGSPLRVETRPVVEVTPQARQLLGAKPTRQGVLFVQPLNSGNRMAIVGEFNNWSESSMPMRRNEELGVYELVVPLAAGRYQYRVVCDGKWTADPYNENFEINSFGETNSVIDVRGARV
jgi:chromosome partitioning protein